MLSHVSEWMNLNCPGPLAQVVTYESDQPTESINEIQTEYIAHLRSYLVKQSLDKSKETSSIQDRIEPSINLGSDSKALLICTDKFVSYLYDSDLITLYGMDIIVLQDKGKKKTLDNVGWSLLVSLLYRRLIIVLMTDLKGYLHPGEKNLSELLEIARVHRVIKARPRAEITKFVELRENILLGIKDMPLKPVFTMISLLQVLEIGKQNY